MLASLAHSHLYTTDTRTHAEFYYIEQSVIAVLDVGLRLFSRHAHF